MCVPLVADRDMQSLGEKETDCVRSRVWGSREGASSGVVADNGHF